MRARALAVRLALLLALALPGLAPGGLLAQQAATDAAPGPTTAAPGAGTTQVDQAGQTQTADQTGQTQAAAPGEPAPTPAPPPPPPEAPQIDMAAWQAVARRAEQAIESGRASDKALQDLRAELVTWRDKFAKARTANSVLIATLKTQINSLGPPPADGQIEPEVISQTRKSLEEQLAKLEAPVKAADLAYQRANTLIAAIDELLRKRQTSALYELGPSPLNPALWPPAISTLTTTLRNAWRGVQKAWGTDTQTAELKRNLPQVIVLLVLAAALLGRGRAWTMLLGRRVSARAEGPAAGALNFVISLGQVALPVAGIYALVQALYAMGVLGLRAQVIADTMTALGASAFGAMWLGQRLFADPGTPWSVFTLGQGRARRARAAISALGFVFGLRFTLEAIGGYEGYSVETLTVLRFPLILAAGLLFAELGLILRRDAAQTGTEDDNPSGFMRYVEANAGRVMLAVGVGAPVIAAVGYGSLAETLIFPSVETFALVSAILVLHQFWVDAYGVVTRSTREEAAQALVPVLVSMLLFLAALPVVALMWGVPATQLQDFYNRLWQGVQIGGTVVTLGDVASLLLVLVLGIVLTKVVQGMLESAILPRTRLDVGARHAITVGVGYVGYVLAALVAVTAAGFNLSSLAIIAGALSVGIGFGLQNVVSNFVSGIILLIERPIAEGDWIEVNGQSGTVREISVRSTRIETFDRTEVIIPNADLIQNTVMNYTRTNLLGRAIVPVGVAYGTDTKRVEEVLLEIGQAHPLVAMNPAPSVYFADFGADSLNFELRVILTNVNFIISVKTEIRHEIVRRFAEEGIEIPFAQRDLWLRNPEDLAAALREGTRPVTVAEAGPAASQGGKGAPGAEPEQSDSIRGDPDE